MSTRCTIHFHDDHDAEPTAIIYRHTDGYPETVHGVLECLERFFETVEGQTGDTRFGDPIYLAAKYVVWQTVEYATDDDLLGVIGVGVCQEDPGDIRYRYHVRCGSYSNRPTVDFEKA